jgi:hypothetical protein
MELRNITPRARMDDAIPKCDPCLDMKYGTYACTCAGCTWVQRDRVVNGTCVETISSFACISAVLKLHGVQAMETIHTAYATRISPAAVRNTWVGADL